MTLEWAQFLELAIQYPGREVLLLQLVVQLQVWVVQLLVVQLFVIQKFFGCSFQRL